MTRKMGGALLGAVAAAISIAAIAPVQAARGGNDAAAISPSHKKIAAGRTPLRPNSFPVFVSPDHTTFVLGTNSQFTVEADGGSEGIAEIFMFCCLPFDLHFTYNFPENTALLHGTPGPGTAGVYDLLIRASNDSGDEYQSFTLTIGEPPQFTSPNTVTFYEDVAMSFTPSASGVPTPTFTESGALPNGITFNSTTGVLSGTATIGTAGSYPITFTASNGINPNATQNFTLIIAPPSCTAVPAGLVGWWPGNGNAVDVQNDNNGALNGPVAFTAGRVGQAFNFNGSTTSISLGNPGALKLRGPMTIEAWVKPTALPANGALMAVATKWNSNSANNASGDAYGLFLRNDNGTLRAHARINTVFGPMTVEGGAVPVNSFSHIAMTVDTNVVPSFRVFVDGTLVGAVGNGTGAIVASNVNVMIGRENDNTAPRFFAGVIDEVGIYNRALTTADFTSIYNAGPAGKCALPACVAPPVNLVAWWSGDNTVVDLQGGITGAMQGLTTFARGKVGQAFYLQDGSSGIDVPYNSYWNFGNDDFTIDLWIRFDGFNSYNVLLSHEAPNVDTSWRFLFNGFNLQFQITGGTSAGVSLTADQIPVTQRWYHVALTRSGNTFKFYLDGTQLSSDQTSTSPVPASSGPLFIGKSNGFISFIGRMDEIEIVHRALSASEIAAIYNAGRSGQCRDVDLYVSNPGTARILRIDPNGNVTPFATGVSNPQGVAFDFAGNLYVVENGLHKIDMFDSHGNRTDFITGLNQPVDLAFDSFGSLYVADYNNNAVEKFSPTGVDLGPFAISPAVNNPEGLTFDAEGNLYIANFGDSTIEKVDPAGSATLYSNSPLISGPTGLACDRDGNLFVSSISTDSIVKVDSLGGASNFASGFSTPFGIAFAPNGSLYVVDQTTGIISKVDATGTVTPFVTSGLSGPIQIAMRERSPIVPMIKVAEPTRPANGHFMVGGQALPNALVTIFSSSSLTNSFTKTGTTTANSNGEFQFDDGTATGQTVRFYRAVYP